MPPEQAPTTITRSGGEPFGSARLLACVHAHRDQPAESIIRMLFDDLESAQLEIFFVDPFRGLLVADLNQRILDPELALACALTADVLEQALQL